MPEAKKKRKKEEEEEEREKYDSVKITLIQRSNEKKKKERKKSIRFTSFLLDFKLGKYLDSNFKTVVQPRHAIFSFQKRSYIRDLGRGKAT